MTFGILSKNANRVPLIAANDDFDELEIGGQIRELRKVKGMTLQQLAADSQISIGYLSQIERNQTKLPIGVLKRISSALNVQLNWFFHASDVTTGERGLIVRANNRRQSRKSYYPPI